MKEDFKRKDTKKCRMKNKNKECSSISTRHFPSVFQVEGK